MSRPLLIALLFALPLHLQGQPQLQEQVRFPAGKASWTITCAQRGAPAATPEEEQPETADTASTEEAPPTVLTRVEVSQNEELRQTVLHWTNGQKRELWAPAGSTEIITEDPRGRTFVTRNSDLFGDPFSAASFEWMKSANPTGGKPISYRGVECYHYKGEIREMLDPLGGETRLIPVQAWIDAKTQLPVALKKGDLMGVFTFAPGPETLEMPAKFSKRLEYFKITMGMP